MNHDVVDGKGQQSPKGLLLKGGQVVDGETGKVSRQDVWVVEGRIARVAPQIDEACAERVVDCAGRVVTAGFVDSHVHIESSMVLPEAFGCAVLPHGTTTVIADPHEVVNVAGAEGLRRFLQEARRAPISVFTVVPSCVPATRLDTNGAGHFTAEQMREFVDLPDVVGLGEVMSFGDVVAQEPEMMAKLELFRGRPIDGHTAGMPDEMLDAYVAQGISNDHECYDAKGVLLRYAKGMNIYIREGSAARNGHDLLACLKENHLDCARFAFCTDDKHLATIAQEGHISYLVRMALQMGFSWGEVARMASYNPCQYYRLAGRGNVREGYVADLVVLDERAEQISLVLKEGRPAEEVLAGHGREEREPIGNSVQFRTLQPADFELKPEARGLAIQLLEGQLLTNPLPLQEGEWQGLNRLATIERYGKNGHMALCPLAGYGIRGGAVATSVSHDSHNVVCAGDNAQDMAVACNRLRELGGGYVLAAGGRVVGEFALPFYGLMSPVSTQEAIEGIARLERQAHEMGVNRGIDPFITLSFVALPVIPTLRLLDTGLYDVLEGRFR